MILVHVPNSWPLVLAGQITAAEAVLKEWHNINDASIEKYGDIVVGIFEHNVVAVFDNIRPGWSRNADGWVTFQGRPSTTWAHLVGTPNPGKPWGVKGMARPVQYLSTEEFTNGTVEVEHAVDSRRAVLDGFTLAIDHQGTAVLTVPAGRKVTVATAAA